MTKNKKLALPMAAACMVLGLMVVAQSASATHPRPKGASPFYAPLALAYNQCAAPTQTHAPPLAFPSCAPTQTSPNLTIGTPDANSAGANSVGFVKLLVVGVPGGVDDTDVLLTGEITDVRCRTQSPPVATCDTANPNTTGSPTAELDYTGEIQAVATIRVTDHNNAPTAAGPFVDPGTLVDIPFPVTGVCSGPTTPNPVSLTQGSTCVIMTTADTVVPGSIPEGKRGNVQIGQVSVTDGGLDGTVATSGNSVFETQGIFIP